MNFSFFTYKTYIFLFGIFFLSPFSFVYAGDSRDIITAERVLELVNESRLNNGMGILSFEASLNRASSLKTKDMFEKQYFAHTTPSGQEPWYFIDLSGYDYRMAGENLAIHFDNALEQHIAWMESPLHRKNILNPEYEDIGITVSKGRFKNFETIIVVQLFGTKRITEVITSQEEMKEEVQEEKVQEVVSGITIEEIPRQEKYVYQEHFFRSFSVEEIIFLLFIVGIPFIVAFFKIFFLYGIYYFSSLFWNRGR
ncbi:MAG: hypothetical protein EOM19_06025 [Candidatus Moranbacteria bacterium]|nr:hypothetical protein [Candidatus Moranbacteria bacterium]